jgi:hypothetical protein
MVKYLACKPSITPITELKKTTFNDFEALPLKVPNKLWAPNVIFGLGAAIEL